MKMKHNPVFPTDKVVEHFSDKDGVPVKYICTTDINNSDLPADIFYRETPHPEFGNRYFGLFYDRSGRVMITNADSVENFEFGMVENDDGELEYSRSHHDYKQFENGNMIDGGRQYIRSSSNAAIMKISNGEFYAKDKSCNDRSKTK